MFKEGIMLLIFLLMKRLAIGSNRELVYMFMDIIGVGLKGSNFQGWHKSFPISGIVTPHPERVYST